MLDWILAALVLIGASFTLIGSIGLYKLPDFFMRLHGPTKATTLGVGAILSPQCCTLVLLLNRQACMKFW